MSSESKSRYAGFFIIINSVIYFVLAYFFVIFVNNVFSMILAKASGFQTKLFYYGYDISGAYWTNENIIVIFFFGLGISLISALLFERIYKARRKHLSNIKLLYLWTYILSLTWFFGGIIVGAFSNFGIGAAMLAINFPTYLKLILAVVSAALLVYLGYYSQKHIVISANLYFNKLQDEIVGRYFIFQILVPAILGILVIMLYRIPHLSDYSYMDTVVLCCIFLFVTGMFIQFKKIKSMIFKRKTDRFRIFYYPLIVLILIIIILKLTLANGLSI